MKCYNKNGTGQSVCESEFLNNTEYVTYAGGHTTETRKNIIGCNNAMENGTKCDLTLKTDRSRDKCANSFGSLNGDEECTDLIEVTE